MPFYIYNLTTTLFAKWMLYEGMETIALAMTMSKS